MRVKRSTLFVSPERQHTKLYPKRSFPPLQGPESFFFQLFASCLFFSPRNFGFCKRTEKLLFIPTPAKPRLSSPHTCTPLLAHAESWPKSFSASPFPSTPVSFASEAQRQPVLSCFTISQSLVRPFQNPHCPFIHSQKEQSSAALSAA